MRRGWRRHGASGGVPTGSDTICGVAGVDWLLKTNVATTGLAAAQKRERWYGARWGIKVLHRTLKTGCQIEERQLGFVARMENCLAIELLARLNDQLPDHAEAHGARGALRTFPPGARMASDLSRVSPQQPLARDATVPTRGNPLDRHQGV